MLLHLQVERRDRGGDAVEVIAEQMHQAVAIQHLHDGIVGGIRDGFSGFVSESGAH